MEEYSFLFGETRIPQKSADELLVTPDSRHIVILRGAHVYALDVIDTSGAVLNDAVIASKINELIQNTPHAPSTSEPLVGMLTSQERDWWAKERQELLRSPINSETIRMIDEALFVVALDYGSYDGPNGFDSNTMSWGVMGQNEHRWWDKNFTLQVDATGVACINFEHAPYDGATVVRMLEDMWHDAADRPRPSGRPAPSPAVLEANTAGNIRKLSFDLSDTSAAAISHATEKFHSFCDITKFQMLNFTAFGKETMKGWRLSPDACIQLAYQLAYFRLHGHHNVSVYESCSTKRFLRGRTEAIRPNTIASSAFVEAVDTYLQTAASGGLQQARKLLDAAASKHREMASAASQGAGVDRHLFSLLSLAQELDDTGATSPLFSDPAWTKFNTSVLSTSNVNSDALVVLGFGAVCPQGYGLGYTVEGDSLRVSVSNFIGDPDTGGSGFGGVALEKSADEAGTVKTNCDLMAKEIERALYDIQKIAMAQPLASKL